MDYQKLTLPQIYDEAEAIAGDAKTHFGHLNAKQLNWKPAADSWSVAQCVNVNQRIRWSAANPGGARRQDCRRPTEPSHELVKGFSNS